MERARTLQARSRHLLILLGRPNAVQRGPLGAQLLCGTQKHFTQFKEPIASKLYVPSGHRCAVYWRKVLASTKQGHDVSRREDFSNTILKYIYCNWLYGNYGLMVHEIAQASFFSI